MCRALCGPQHNQLLGTCQVVAASGLPRRQCPDQLVPLPDGSPRWAPMVNPHGPSECGPNGARGCASVPRAERARVGACNKPCALICPQGSPGMHTDTHHSAPSPHTPSPISPPCRWRCTRVSTLSAAQAWLRVVNEKGCCPVRTHTWSERSVAHAWLPLSSGRAVVGEMGLHSCLYRARLKALLSGCWHHSDPAY